MATSLLPAVLTVRSGTLVFGKLSLLIPFICTGWVQIFDRHGEHIQEIPLDPPGKCIALDWDREGQVGFPECLPEIEIG